MHIAFQPNGIEKWQADAVAFFVFQDDFSDAESLASLCPSLLEAAPWLGIAPAVRDFTAKKDTLSVIYGPPMHPLNRIVLLGLGKKASYPCPAMQLDAMRKAAARFTRTCRDLNLDSCAVIVPNLAGLASERYPLERIAEEIVCGSLLGLYRYTALKTCKEGELENNDPRCLNLCSLDMPNDALALAAKRGESMAKAVSLARNLVNGPGNAITPEFLADQARKLSGRYNMSLEVFDRKAIEGMGMEAFASVAAGSVNEPRLIVLEHAPKGHEESPPLVLVGKGLTFDSGGISLKPSAGMQAMKGDMAGAAAVLGVFEALGLLDVPRRVIGLLACAENMPDARATRPGDVVKTLAGKTVEINNTDAEGRLVLCDTLSYAQNRWQPYALIDIATLTGACSVTLGNTVAGLFSPDTVLTEAIRGLGETVGEMFWPLPTWDRYFESLKSDTADFLNAGPREGGACTAAVFLKQFIQPNVRWAHLDIAGTASTKKAGPLCPEGGTGFGVRTLLELAQFSLSK